VKFAAHYKTVFLYGSENPTNEARDAIIIKAAEMKCTRKTAECTWRDYKKYRDCNGTNMTPVLDKMHDRLPKIRKKNYRSKRRKEAGKTTEETLGRVRPEWLDKWPNPMIVRLLLLLLLLLLL